MDNYRVDFTNLACKLLQSRPVEILAGDVIHASRTESNACELTQVLLIEGADAQVPTI